MSGGVDSSVAAFLLKKQGYDVTGVFMRCFNLDGCAWRDAEDARRVAVHLDIPFYIWDFEKEYKKRVVNYMINGYRKGITPNPDVMCNKEIKFGLFFEKALEMGADYVATGHYVRISCSTNHVAHNTQEGRSQDKIATCYKLHVACDKNKDQSYFLWTLTQKQLKYCLFPIGDYLKSEVRKIARRAGLPTAEKKDSQGICFLGKVALGDFLKGYIKPKRGNVVTAGGKKVGEHEGAYYYTIGQRHGLGIGGGKPYYVAEKDVKSNILTVAEESNSPALYRKEVELTDINFVSQDLKIENCPLRRSRSEASKLETPVLARVRYRQPLFAACLMRQASSVKLIFGSPQKFVAPGQSAVFYSRRGELLGGGVIIHAKYG